MKNVIVIADDEVIGSKMMALGYETIVIDSLRLAFIEHSSDSCNPESKIEKNLLKSAEGRQVLIVGTKNKHQSIASLVNALIVQSKALDVFSMIVE